MLHPTIKLGEEYGLNITPCKSKRPTIPEWQNTKLSIEDIKDYASKGYGLGFICGPTEKGHHLVVMEFDDKEIYDALKDRMPPTLIIESSIKEEDWRGKHYYYLISSGFQNLDLKDGRRELFSIRSDRRFVVGPGTPHPTGVTYDILNDVPITKIHPMTLSLIYTYACAEFGQGQSGAIGLMDIVKNPPKIGEGSDESTFFLATALRRMGYEKNKAIEFITKWWRGSPSFINDQESKEWIQTKVNSAYKPSEPYGVFFKENITKQILNLDSMELESKDNGLPPTWKVNSNGIFQETIKGVGEKATIVWEPASKTPFFIEARGINIDTMGAYIKLGFNGIIEEQFFPQKTLAQQTSCISTLSEIGVNVTQPMSRRTVTYISDCIAHQNGILPNYEVTEKQGWKSGSRFVLGEKIYSKNGVQDIYLKKPSKRLDGIRTSGTVESWYDIAEGLLKYDIVRFKCYASASSIILKLLGNKSFLIDDYGETSTGKTRTSELAMSIWGDPAMLAFTGSLTVFGAEQIATAFCDLPIFIDETTTLNDNVLETLVYMLANESGKVRGQADGTLQQTQSWKTVGFFTGEIPVRKSHSKGGLSARTISLYGGLGEHDPIAMETFKDGVISNHGAVGVALLQKVLTQDPQELKELFQKAKKKLQSEFITSIESRLADTFANICIGGVLFESILEEHNLPSKKPLSIVKNVYSMTINEISETQYLDNFLQAFSGWCISNKSNFLGGGYEDDKIKEVYGKWEHDLISIYPHILRKYITELGFDYDRVLKDCKERSMIKVQEKGNTYPTRIYTKMVKMVCFFPEKLFELEEERVE